MAQTVTKAIGLENITEYTTNGRLPEAIVSILSEYLSKDAKLAIYGS